MFEVNDTVQWAGKLVRVARIHEDHQDRQFAEAQVEWYCPEDGGLIARWVNINELLPWEKPRTAPKPNIDALRYRIAALIEKETGEKTWRDEMDEIMAVVERRWSR